MWCHDAIKRDTNIYGRPRTFHIAVVDVKRASKLINNYYIVNEDNWGYLRNSSHKNKNFKDDEKMNWCNLIEMKGKPKLFFLRTCIKLFKPKVTYDVSHMTNSIAVIYNWISPIFFFYSCGKNTQYKKFIKPIKYFAGIRNETYLSLTNYSYLFRKLMKNSLYNNYIDI